MILTNENEMFIDYNVGPVFLMNLTGIQYSVKEIKALEDHKKLKCHISFYAFNEVITKKTLSKFLRPIVSQLKKNNIWFSVRPTGFTDSVGDFSPSLLSFFLSFLGIALSGLFPLGGIG